MLYWPVYAYHAINQDILSLGLIRGVILQQLQNILKVLTLNEASHSMLFWATGSLSLLWAVT